jgi:mannose/fructose/N-acetylgalactosamine-specific phosphotransferase system component IID
MILSIFVTGAVVIAGVCITLTIVFRNKAEELMKDIDPSYTGYLNNIIDLYRIFKVLVCPERLIKKNINFLWFYFIISVVQIIIVVMLIIMSLF